jgi:hypothetical protein
MILKAHVPDAPSHEIGDEIWQQSLPDAIRAVAEIIADDAGPGLLEPADKADRGALRERTKAEMSQALMRVGDTYRAPDGVLYSLTDRPELDPRGDEGRVTSVSSPTPGPVVEEVLRFEDLPLGPAGTRSGEVVVSNTVRALVNGAGIAFRDHGTRRLKGIPEPAQLFSVAGVAA